MTARIVDRLCVAVAVLFILLMIGACAHAPLGHSEMWKACRAHCEEIGGVEPVMLENSTGRGCVCSKKPEAT